MAQNPFMLAPKTPVSLQKSILKLLLTFDRFFDRFLVPSWRQNRAQDRPRRPQDAPKTATWPQLAAQVAPKTVPRRPKTAPRRAQDGHLAPTCRPSHPQDGPKTAQDGPNRPQIDRRTPQDASKTAQDENSRDLAKNSRDLAKSKAKNKDITHDPKRTPDFKAECCQLSSRPQIARTPKTWGGGAPPLGGLQYYTL